MLPARIRLQSARAANTIAPWLDAADAALSLALWAVPGKTSAVFVSSLSWPTRRHVVFRPVAKDFSSRCAIPDRALERIQASLADAGSDGRMASSEGGLSDALSRSLRACGFGPEAALASFLGAVSEISGIGRRDGFDENLEASVASTMGIQGRLSICPAYASIRVASVERPWELSAHERLDLRMRISASPILEEFSFWWLRAMEGEGLG